MRLVSKKMKVIFYVILFSAFLTSLTHIKAQSNFIRNDNFDFMGEHYIYAEGESIDNFSVFLAEDSSDFRKFKLHVNLFKLVIPFYPAYAYRVDMNNDGVWETEVSSISGTVSFIYPNPSGISGNFTIKIEITFWSSITHQYIPRIKTIPITIFSAVRTFVDSDNNAFIQLRDEDPTTKIPVIMLEGFDPLNEKFPEIYYNLTWELINTSLYPNGYEVFILNFANGGRDLRLNATVVIKAIEKVHEICPNFKIALAGLSMGGPIGRYALANKEDQGGTHDVGLFLSYDSPQDGAHINPSLQDWIKGQNPNESAIYVMQENLKSIGAKQMLLYNTYDPLHVFRDEFYNELNALNGDGYPHQSYNVSVSNGNFVAKYGYEQEGRHLLTFKISDALVTDINAVKLDVGTGSLITDITTKRYGDIFPIPWLPIFGIPYSMEIIFNPAYQTTYSALNLIGYQINEQTGDITTIGTSKFDDFVVQTTPLQHHELSQLTHTTIMEWLNLDFNIGVNYSLLEGGTTSPDNYQTQILHSIPITVQPKTVNINGKQVTYNFEEWEDRNKSNPRTFYASHDLTHTATMKGHLFSSTASGFNSNSQRKIAKTDAGPLHIVYESMNAIWYTRSTDNGTTWLPEIKVSPSGINAKSPSISESTGTGLVYIVYQQAGGISPYFFPSIILARYQGGIKNWEEEVYSLDTYDYDTKPVVGAYNGAHVVFKPTSTSPLIAKFFSPDGNPGTNRTINNTDANSINPSLVVAGSREYLAYQNGTTQIRYLDMDGSGVIYEYKVVSSGGDNE